MAREGPRPAEAREDRGIGQALDRAWRTAVTFFASILIALLGLWAGAVLSPLIRLGPGDARTKELRFQYCIHLVLRFYFFLFETLGACRIHCDAPERLRAPGTLVVANHVTAIDALVLIAHMPQADCVVKERWYRDRFLGFSARAAGYVPATSGPELVDACVERLLDRRSVIIFPEGTRSPEGRLGPFARGAAHIALRSRRDPVPVTIRCEPATLGRDRNWWDVPERRFELTLSVGEPLMAKEVLDGGETRGLAARKLTAALRSHFESERRSLV